MKLNWFPGHMKKTLAEIRTKLANIDVVVYVLDSRAPISSINPSLDRLSQNKPVLYVFNKLDLANETRVKEIAKDYRGEKKDFILLNSTTSGSSKIIRQKLNLLANEKIEKFKKKGIKTVVRAIVVGVPNSGKSTLVNNLCGKAKAVTGNRAGVTKMTQWVSIGDNIEICDTPGTLYPNLEDQEVAKKLLFIGSIKDEIVADNAELAEELIKSLELIEPGICSKRYGEDLSLEGIAKKRGFVVGGGEFDIYRTANAVIDDFRKGRLGRITLD